MNQAINYLYANIDLSQLTYEIIRYNDNLKVLLNKQYYLSYNYSGKNYFLIFFDDKIYFIDRTTLNFNKNNLRDLSKISYKCIQCKTNEIPNNTIIDGIYVIKKNGDNAFIINDIYTYNNINLMKENIKKKIEKYNFIINNTFTIDKNTELNLSINNQYDLIDIDFLILNKTNNTYHIRGLCFNPEFSGKKYIFVDELKMDQKLEPFVKLKVEPKAQPKTESKAESKDELNTKPLVEQMTELKIDVNEEHIFEMEKTNVFDIYKLYNNKLYIGIALIQTLKESKYFNDLYMSNMNNKQIKCKFNTKFKKWQPIIK